MPQLATASPRVPAPHWQRHHVTAPDESDAAADIALARDLDRLEDAMLQMERARSDEVSSAHPDHRADAVNLVHYLAFRHGDVRTVQRRLSARGLSSLGRCEPHVLATVEKVRELLIGGAVRSVPSSLSFEAGRAALDHNTDALFGARPEGRVTRVMVTLPLQAAADGALVRHLVASGMDVARINGAHDDPAVWTAMAHNVRIASADVSRPCLISVDLPGPKLRTGPFEAGPEVVRLKPERDLRGRALAPASATLVADPSVPSATHQIPVDPAWLTRRRSGDEIWLRDARGSKRRLLVTEVGSVSCDIVAWDTTYLETGCTLECKGDRTVVGILPSVPQFHTLRPGDLLVLTRSLTPSEPWRPGQSGVARIGCTLPAVFEAATLGQSVFFDDGKMAGAIEQTAADSIVVRITRASPRGTRLRAGKGINLPETDLPIDAVTDADLPLLQFAAEHADMVAVSFVRSEHDVAVARTYLQRVGAADVGLILKIETPSAFSRLPEILLDSMRSRLVGIMIARGDLAVEAGYERMAELQEEILWLCEAAHLPVIWATQVLDQLARTGQPSRAEVTDAAMAQRAECVMLNKGPHVDTAIVVLDDILRRMSGHQRKKTALLRALRSWDDEGTSLRGPS
ncbi:MAG: pyruvate kinase [Acidimicrobiales bacterium]